MLHTLLHNAHFITKCRNRYYKNASLLQNATEHLFSDALKDILVPVVIRGFQMLLTFSENLTLQEAFEIVAKIYEKLQNLNPWQR